MLEAAGAHILHLGLRAEQAPSCLSQDVGYPVWQWEKGAPGFKGSRKWSGDGERCKQDRGRRQTRPETRPCGAEPPRKFVEFSACKHTLKLHALIETLEQIGEQFVILFKGFMLLFSFV